MSSVSHQEAVSKILRQFGEEGIRAPDGYLEEAVHLAQRVFEKLKQKAKRFPINETRFSGSISKKTHILKPDLDLVVRVNNFKPPMKHEEVLDEWEEILLLHQRELGIQEGSVEQRTKYSVQFVFQNGLEVDLLPAPDLEPIQYLQMISRNPKDFYDYNTCFVEKQVAFVKSHSSNFVLCLIRLLKFWKKSLVGLGKLSGGSYLMEIIAVASAVEEEKQSTPDILRAFARAIEWISKLDTFKLAFEEISSKRWIRLPTIRLISRDCTLLPRVIGTLEILNSRSFVIDPANPYNDLLACQKKDKIDKLMEYAKVTKKRLDDLRALRGSCIKQTRNGLELDILQLFRSQPWNSTREFPIRIPSDFFAGYEYSVSSLFPDMKVRKQGLLRDPGIRNCVEMLKWNFISAVSGAVHGQPGKAPTEKKNDVRENIRYVIKSALNTELAPSNAERHEQMDVTLIIPYSVNDRSYAVKASFSWS